MTKALVEAGAQLFVVDANGLTALDKAVRKGQQEIARLLRFEMIKQKKASKPAKEEKKAEQVNKDNH